MLQNPCKTLGFKKNMVYKIPPGGGGKPYPASGLLNKPSMHRQYNCICVLCNLVTVRPREGDILIISYNIRSLGPYLAVQNV